MQNLSKKINAKIEGFAAGIALRAGDNISLNDLRVRNSIATEALDQNTHARALTRPNSDHSNNDENKMF